jgi:hypothetical protein
MLAYHLFRNDAPPITAFLVLTEPCPTTNSYIISKQPVSWAP